MFGCASTSLEQQYKGQSAQQIFNTGEQALAKKKYDKATKSFEALNAMYPFGDYSEQAQLDLIYAYYKNDDSASALATADRFIRLYPRSEHVDYAYYMKGLINYGRSESWLQRMFPTNPADRDLSYMREAFSDFDTLVQLFPNSRYAADARQHMVYIRNILAQHEVNVANFYLLRKAYVAAANRASSVVENYQGTPQVLPALSIMVRAYRGLHESQMANRALQVIQLNYPNSKEYKALARGH